MGGPVREMHMNMIDTGLAEEFGEIESVAGALRRLVTPAVVFLVNINQRLRPFLLRLARNRPAWA